MFRGKLRPAGMDIPDLARLAKPKGQRSPAVRDHIRGSLATSFEEFGWKLSLWHCYSGQSEPEYGCFEELHRQLFFSSRTADDPTRGAG